MIQYITFRNEVPLRKQCKWKLNWILSIVSLPLKQYRQKVPCFTYYLAMQLITLGYCFEGAIESVRMNGRVSIFLLAGWI